MRTAADDDLYSKNPLKSKKPLTETYYILFVRLDVRYSSYSIMS